MSILEFIDNTFQLLVTLGVGICSAIFAIRNPKFLPFQYLCGAAICWFLGTLYWTIYFMIYGEFVYYFSVSELCYLCLYLFLIGLCTLLHKEHAQRKPMLKQVVLSFVLPLFVFIINTISYIMYGGLFWHLFYAIPLMILAYTSSKNLFILTSKPLHRFHLAIVSFVIFNNLMFLVSCFELNELYIIFDFMFTSSFLVMLFYLKKETEL